MEKRRKPFKIILIAICVTVGVLAAASVIYVDSFLSRISAPENIEQIAPENEFFEYDGIEVNDAPVIDPMDIVWPAGEQPEADQPEAEPPAPPATSTGKEVVNILLIGQDKRPGEKRARSDAMIIASYSENDGKLTLISLMRDMYVPIPGYSDNRINAAYQFGGMKLLDKTIEKNFGVGIDGNFEINFEGFSQLVDMLGGIDLSLNTTEATHLNKKFGWKLARGKNHLNGQQTLEYARIRYVGNGDFERTERQRIVLRQIFDGIMQLNLAKKYQLLEKMLPFLTTDMSKQKILGYVSMVLAKGVTRTESFRIPADGSYKQAKVRNMAVLVPNLTKIRALINNYIYK